ncbi:MAG: hypothetical protein RQ752_14880 [Thermohalobaculum sp.]|nr:hypothetical protein [Thermohalobaculum sp.]
MSGRRAPVGFALLGALVLAVGLHGLGLVSDRTLDLVTLGSVGWMVFRAASGALGGTAAMGVALGAVGALGAARIAVPTLAYMPYLLIAPVNLGLAAVFAHGLLPGRRPVLLALIELIGRAPTDDRAFRRFVAGQCALWSVLTLGTSLLAAAALVDAPARPDLAMALRLLIGVQVVWFALSHSYARRRYGRPETWWLTLRAMARPDIWTHLRAQ